MSGNGSKPARRRPGGQEGNLNAARWPWAVFWRRRALRDGDRWILPYVRSYGDSLMSDRPDASEAEKRTIELAATARGCQLLILAFSTDRGIVTPINRSTTVASELRAFASLELNALRVLGLERRAKALPSAIDILAASREESQP